jgi:hypothetical protein
MKQVTTQDTSYNTGYKLQHMKQVTTQDTSYNTGYKLQHRIQVTTQYTSYNTSHYALLFPPVAQQPKSGLGRLNVEVPTSHTHTNWAFFTK